MATSQSSIVVQMTSDEARLLEGMRKIIEKEQQMGDGLSKADREAAKLEKSMQKAADKIKELNLTPLERYQREVAKADELLQKGKLTQEQFNREVARQGTIMASRTTQEQSFAGALRQTAAEMLGVQSIIRGIETAFTAVEQAKGKALTSFRASAGPDALLNQVSNDATDLQAMKDRADRAAGIYGVDRTEARALMGSARGEGYEADFERILAGNAVVNPQAAGNVAGQLPALFQNSIKPMEAIDMTLAASRASRLSFEGIAAAAPIAAEGAALQGSTADEALALLSILSQRFKSGETAGDRLKTFAIKASLHPELAGRGVMGAVDILQQMPEEERAAFLGDSTELNTAYGIMSQEREAIRGREQEISAALAASRAGRGELQLGIERASANPTFQAEEVSRRKKIEADLIRERTWAQAAAEEDASVNNMVSAAYYFGGGWAGAAAEAGRDNVVGRGAYSFGYRAAEWIDQNRGRAAALAATPFTGGASAIGTLFGGGQSNEENVSAAAKDLRDAAADIRAAAAENRPAAARAKAAFGRDQ